MNDPHRKRATCRACGGEALERFLELGPQPLANAFPRTPEEFGAEGFFPLDVYFCSECSLVQLLDVIDPEVLFGSYIYVSGTSATVPIHFAEYSRNVAARLALTDGQRVIEVASNDGTLLKQFRERGATTLGIEPASNIAALAREAGIETLCEFFSSEVAESVRRSHGTARAVVANNVLAHVDETVDFLRGCRILLDPDGLVVIEAPYLRELLDRLEYDTVYHEHLCYFSVTALDRLFREAGLEIVDLEFHPIHGGSLRIFGGHPGAHEPTGALDRYRAEEQRSGMTDATRYRRFGEDVAASRTALVSHLEALRDGGARLAAYGAPAKGNTLLNYCSIGTDLIPYTVDKNDLKVGRYTPGMHLPVRPATTLANEQPDHTLILAWNFAEEIVKQQDVYRENGGRFIVPIPEPRSL